jgi:hypothetical protein
MVATAWPVIDAPTRKAQTLRQLQIIDARACVCQANDPGFWDEACDAAHDCDWEGWTDSVPIRRVMVALDLPSQFTIKHVAEWWWWRAELDELIDHSFDGHMGEFR